MTGRKRAKEEQHQCLCDTNRGAIEMEGYARDDDTGKGYSPKSLKAGMSG